MNLNQNLAETSHPNQKSKLILPTESSLQLKNSSLKPSQKRKTWTYEQNVLYVRFLRLHSNKFSVNDGDKKFRKYKKMSLFLQSKTPKQCRTHHQKMMIKFGQVEKIIEGLINQKSQSYQIEKTEDLKQFENQNQNFSKPEVCMMQDLEKPEKYFLSCSSEKIFDILF